MKPPKKIVAIVASSALAIGVGAGQIARPIAQVAAGTRFPAQRPAEFVGAGEIIEVQAGCRRRHDRHPCALRESRRTNEGF